MSMRLISILGTLQIPLSPLDVPEETCEFTIYQAQGILGAWNQPHQYLISTSQLPRFKSEGQNFLPALWGLQWPT